MLTTGTVLYSRSPKLIHFAQRQLYALCLAVPISPSPQPQATSPPFPIPWIWPHCPIQVEPCSICPSMTSPSQDYFWPIWGEGWRASGGRKVNGAKRLNQTQIWPLPSHNFLLTWLNKWKKRKLCPTTGNQTGAHSCLKTWVSKGVEKSERGLGESPSLAALLLLALSYISVGKLEKHQDLPTSLVGWGGVGRSGEDPCQPTKSYCHFWGHLFTCCILFQREQILNLNPREDPSGSQIPRAATPRGNLSAWLRREDLPGH